MQGAPRDHTRIAGSGKAAQDDAGLRSATSIRSRSQRSISRSSGRPKRCSRGAKAASTAGVKSYRSPRRLRQGERGWMLSADCRPSGIGVFDPCARSLGTSFASKCVCGPSGDLPPAGGIGWNTSIRPAGDVSTRWGWARKTWAISPGAEDSALP
jgi:hypothetical protein